MKSVHFASGKKLSRRAVLRNAGVCLGLPVLDAMTPAFAAAASPASGAKRFVGVSLALGLHGPNLNPKGAGTDYQAVALPQAAAGHPRQVHRRLRRLAPGS